MRVCEDFPEAQDEEIANAARQILATIETDWLEFSKSPGEVSEEFLYTQLHTLGIQVDDSKKGQMRRCLFRHLALEDARITLEDEHILRYLYQANRSDDSLLPGQPDFFQKLVAIVRAGFPGRPLSFLRAQLLAAELSRFIVRIRK